MITFSDRWPRWVLATLALAIVAVVGGADYLTGHEVLFSTFYLLAVALAAWTIGRVFAALISLLSVGAWLAGDFAAGAAYSQPYVPVWNASIILVFYLVVVWLLDSLRSMQNSLEERVKQRTIALTEEMTERRRLEREILEVGEVERRRIGHDLHDSLGQHLTGTALASQVLEDKLAARRIPEATDASRIVTLIEQAIELTRSLARGLHPVEVESGGLTQGLQDLAASTSELFRLNCEFRCESSVALHDAATATHLYRIAQEAVANAIKHGKAGHIVLRLDGVGGGVRLMVTDDGVGIADVPHPGQGMGLRIMAHRAGMIGGALDVRRGAAGGTTVTCELQNT